MCPCFIDRFASSLLVSLPTPSLSLPSFCYFWRVSAIQSNSIWLYIKEDHYPCLYGMVCCDQQWTGMRGDVATQEGQLSR